MLAAGDRAWVMDVNQPGRLALPLGIKWFDWSSDGTKVLGIRGSRELVEWAVDGAGDLREFGKFAELFVAGFYDSGPTGNIIGAGPGANGILTLRAVLGPETPKPEMLTNASEQAFHPRLTPDGRRVVYVSRESGRPDGLFVQPFPGPGRRQQIATGGTSPEWRGDGKEIVYLTADGVWCVEVHAVGNDLRFGPPRQLFSAVLRQPGGPGLNARLLAVSRDGSRFFYPLRLHQPEASVIHLKTGWVQD
jgi:hypothetical protein